MGVKTFNELIEEEIGGILYDKYPVLTEQGLIDAISHVKELMIKSIVVTLNPNTFDEFETEEMEEY